METKIGVNREKPRGIKYINIEAIDKKIIITEIEICCTCYTKIINALWAAKYLFKNAKRAE